MFQLGGSWRLQQCAKQGSAGGTKGNMARGKGFGLDR
jgi:hypothetical protein